MADGSTTGMALTATRALGRATAQLAVILAVIEALRREYLGATPPEYPRMAVAALAAAWVTLAVTALRAAHHEPAR